jgi:hypothetical protein
MVRGEDGTVAESGMREERTLRRRSDGGKIGEAKSGDGPIERTY